MKANETIPEKGKCFCTLAEVYEQVQEGHKDQEEGPPGPDELDTATSQQDGDQRHPNILPSPPEEPLPQTVEDLPEDMVEETTPPPVEVVETTSKRPVPVSRGGQDKASLHIKETVPVQGMRRTHTDRPQRPERIRKKCSKFIIIACM